MEISFSLCTGSYGRLTITFEFKRRIKFYLISWYVPATLIVALSWVGFWIEYKSTPARISLGTITILAMGSFLIGGQEGFPQVSYIRAIDIYLITCFVFVFGCMAEYAILHYTTRRLEEEEHRRNKKHEVCIRKSRLYKLFGSFSCVSYCIFNSCLKIPMYFSFSPSPYIFEIVKCLFAAFHR